MSEVSKTSNKEIISPKLKKILAQALIYVILLVCSIVVIYPFFYMVVNSIKPATEILNNPGALPKKISLAGYTGVFQSLNIPRLFFNTIFISGSVTILNTLFSAMIAYGLVKSDVPGKNFFTNIILASMMIPGVLLLIPTYMMMYSWHWVDSYKVLIIPGAISAYNIFLMVQFMGQIDNGYLEAARIDGASEPRIFFRIVLPMALPALTTIAILTFMGSWNDMFGPLLYLRSESMMTIQLAIFKFSSTIPGKYLEQLWAALTIVTVPVVIVYFFLQKNFVKAFTGVGIK